MINMLKNLFGQTDNTEMIEKIKTGATLVDVRSEGEFRNGSVKGAINIPLDKLEGQMNKLKNKKDIIVFCQSGNRSSRAKSILENNGFSNVYNGGGVHQVRNMIH